MAQTKYKFNIVNGKVSFKFDFNAEQTALFDQKYNYPLYIPNPQDPSKTILNTMSRETFWFIIKDKEKEQDMREQFKSNKRIEAEENSILAVDVGPIEEV